MIKNPDSILVRYGELALKDSNRGLFERQLQSNLETRLVDLPTGSVERFQGGMRIPVNDNTPAETIIDHIGTVPGVAWFAPGISTERNPETIGSAVLRQLDASNVTAETFAVRTQRSDKSLERNSMDFDREIGGIVNANTDMDVDLDNPDVTISVQILFTEAFVFFNRYEGLGGLPVGSSGQVLSLLSGGIDSPVSSIQIMKRGCRTDFLHFYPYPSARQALDAKFHDLVEQLARYTTEGTLYLAPYHEYDLRKAAVSERKELVLFRRHMMRVADRIARRNDLRAIVTGESVGQVASQTLENINSIQRATQTTILRPLIGLDKNDIIDLARSFGTYSISIEDYQDCCSIQSTRVDTKTNPDQLKSIEEKHDLYEADDAVLDELTLVDFDSGGVQRIRTHGKEANSAY